MEAQPEPARPPEVHPQGARVLIVDHAQRHRPPARLQGGRQRREALAEQHLPAGGACLPLPALAPVLGPALAPVLGPALAPVLAPALAPDQRQLRAREGAAEGEAQGGAAPPALPLAERVERVGLRAAEHHGELRGGALRAQRGGEGEAVREARVAAGAPERRGAAEGAEEHLVGGEGRAAGDREGAERVREGRGVALHEAERQQRQPLRAVQRRGARDGDAQVERGGPEVRERVEAVAAQPLQGVVADGAACGCASLRSGTSGAACGCGVPQQQPPEAPAEERPQLSVPQRGAVRPGRPLAAAAHAEVPRAEVRRRGRPEDLPRPLVGERRRAQLQLPSGRAHGHERAVVTVVVGVQRRGEGRALEAGEDLRAGVRRPQKQFEVSNVEHRHLRRGIGRHRHLDAQRPMGRVAQGARQRAHERDTPVEVRGRRGPRGAQVRPQLERGGGCRAAAVAQQRAGRAAAQESAAAALPPRPHLQHHQNLRVRGAHLDRRLGRGRAAGGADRRAALVEHGALAAVPAQRARRGRGGTLTRLRRAARRAARGLQRAHNQHRPVRLGEAGELAALPLAARHRARRFREHQRVRVDDQSHPALGRLEVRVRHVVARVEGALRPGQAVQAAEGILDRRVTTEQSAQLYVDAPVLELPVELRVVERVARRGLFHRQEGAAPDVQRWAPPPAVEDLRPSSLSFSGRAPAAPTAQAAGRAPAGGQTGT